MKQIENKFAVGGDYKALDMLKCYMPKHEFII